MKIQGETFPAGTFLILRERNQSDGDQDILLPAVQKWAKDFRGELVALQTSYPDSGRQGPGSESVQPVKTPRVGIVFGDDSSTTDFGSPWFLFEQELRLPFTPLTKRGLSGDISRFSCIIFPNGGYDAPSDKLREWISNGGCAVVLGGRWAVGDKALLNLDQVKVDKDKSPGYLPGTIFKAELDPRSFLSFGYPHNGDAKIPIAVPMQGNRFYKMKPEGGSVVTFSSNAAVSKLLSGWEWPDDTEKNLQGVVWVQDQPIGQGHVIWFADDPTQRDMWPGLNRMLLNAVLLGPS
jgi:hypothetical protein